jgi:transcriptional antiterminator NusG
VRCDVIELSNNAENQSPDQSPAEADPGQPAEGLYGSPMAADPSPAQPIAGVGSTSDGPVEDSRPADEAPAGTEVPPEEEAQKDWYVLKVQSNREESIREGLLRRINIEGLNPYFGEIIVPTELRSEFKNGRKRVLKVKLWPGYLVVNMAINDATWHLVRGTPGIGDFVGSTGKPTPMLPQDVDKIRAKQEAETDEVPKLKIKFNPGDRVKITEGTFENFEGTVDSIDVPNGRVTVMINIFGRSTPVELEYWQVEGL